MRPPRFRIRTLLVVVAVVAVGPGAEKMWRRSRVFRQRAEHFAKEERVCIETLGFVREELAESRAEESAARASGEIAPYQSKNVAMWEDVVGQVGAHLGYNREMHRKYEYAAAHPWYSVPPDPTEPPLHFPE